MTVNDIIPAFGITWVLIIATWFLTIVAIYGLSDKIDKIKEEKNNESSN